MKQTQVVDAISPSGSKGRISMSAYLNYFKDKGWTLYSDYAEDESEEFAPEVPPYTVIKAKTREDDVEHGDDTTDDEVSSDYKISPGGLNG